MADFTIADVLAWARTKPAEEAYSYLDFGNCALCHFLRETGRSAKPRVRGDAWRHGIGERWIEFPNEQFAHALSIYSHTYGALVGRLEKLCPEAVIASPEWAAIDAYLTDIDAVSADKLAPASIQPHTV